MVQVVLNRALHQCSSSTIFQVVNPDEASLWRRCLCLQELWWKAGITNRGDLSTATVRVLTALVGEGLGRDSLDIGLE